ncbi:MAG: hypothetical protein H6815_04965 [Phycisphaeraceae bacterium]|nr:hypothetical protein [Phycisphaerales bacterium]MCB9859786.1 hypothetical protein [Phycisphaeraceae bacterium]
MNRLQSILVFFSVLTLVACVDRTDQQTKPSQQAQIPSTAWEAVTLDSFSSGSSDDVLDALQATAELFEAFDRIERAGNTLELYGSFDPESEDTSPGRVTPWMIAYITAPVDIDTGGTSIKIIGTVFDRVEKKDEQHRWMRGLGAMSYRMMWVAGSQG